MRKWIIWSFDAQEDQTFADIVVARDVRSARAKVKRGRPYVTLDLYCPGEDLDTYIAALQKAAAQSNHTIEKNWKEI